MRGTKPITELSGLLVSKLESRIGSSLTRRRSLFCRINDSLVVYLEGASDLATPLSKLRSAYISNERATRFSQLSSQFRPIWGCVKC